ncbi:hypothetical protein M8C21_007886 [Ambrosia artemisiifolia]|uniref:Uncharacterized protein n=1 Tax=Ambrosia artemisiifolia TaxID=4212 RepID=A0AAD5BRW0_AMBAR|nr:hypothetical protein M8C21_007886 [Ambrosia artemisiifolia]
MFQYHFFGPFHNVTFLIFPTGNPYLDNGLIGMQFYA